MSSVVIFGIGLLTGTILTFLWSKCFKIEKCNEEKPNEDEEEVTSEFTPQSEHGSDKLILAVRNDLKMGKGKVAAQCAHGAVMAHEQCRKKYPDIFCNWKRRGQPKIVVKIDSEAEMWDLIAKAKKYHLLISVVQDAGRTQVPSGSRTVLAIGPGPENLINEVTGHLKLY